uniref:C-type lectin domain-containing protein n=2 Tax=Ciona intestinalis TaxID=7719 RepID=F6Z4P5_CIOIN
MKLLALILILQSLEVVLGSWYSLATTEYFVNASGKIVKSYKAAVEACALMNATLALVKTEQVHSFLVEKIGNVTSIPYSFYIGLKRSNVSTTGFQWNDGANETASNTLWLKGEPNNNYRIENCVQMGLREPRKIILYKWNDVFCNAPGRYICQRSGAITPTASKSPAPYYVIAIVGIIFVAAAGCALFYFKKKGNPASEKQVTNDAV